MRKYLFIVSLATMAILLGSTSLFAQKLKAEQVPANVRQTFERAYPTASKVKWEMDDSPKTFEAEFKLGKLMSSAEYALDGTLMEFQQEIQLKDAPMAVRDALAKAFTRVKIEEVERTTADGVVTYEVEGTFNGVDKELVYSDDGKLLREELESEDPRTGKD